ncbi:MAG: hypothetical protein NC517_06205 [Firmicutes bacterium]|nr:hypothetical protein [Bacillota bacterium]
MRTLRCCDAVALKRQESAGAVSVPKVQHGGAEKEAEILQVQDKLKPRIMPVCGEGESLCREYAGPSSHPARRQEKADTRAEREKLKEALLPFVRETVKKQLKEEREYYRSRPLLAARQLESVLGQGQLLTVLTGQVCDRVERQSRLEKLRKSRV